MPVNPIGIFDGACMRMMVTDDVAGATRCLNDDGSLTFYNRQIGEQVLWKVEGDEAEAR